MNDNNSQPLDYNRRDFLKGGSVATLMGLMGGVRLFGQTAAEPAPAAKVAGPKYKVAVIGLGRWGREIINTLTLAPKAPVGAYQVEVAAICDNYAAALRRTSEVVPTALKTEDYKTILENKDIPAVIVATPTHKHKEIVLAALKAGKHVYCEAPLANNIDDAREIAAAAKGLPKQIFQAGLQDRSDPERTFLLPFIREGNLGKNLQTRAQFHKKYSWRQQSPNAQREKDMNWCLDKTVSLGLVGEMGIHPLDQAAWFFNLKPRAITGFGSILNYDDGRDVADTAQVVCEFAGGVRTLYDVTLGNSFEANYEVFYGTNGAIFVRDSKAWMFKETDSPLFGWEVYARKTSFYTEFKTTGISLMAGASKGVVPSSSGAEETPALSGPLFYALGNFVKNCNDYGNAITDYTENFGDDLDGLLKHLGEKVHKRPAAGYLEGYQATVIAVKANEAVLAGKRVEIERDLYELK